MKARGGAVVSVDVVWVCDGSENSGFHAESGRLALTYLNLEDGSIGYETEPCGTAVVHDGVEALVVECDLCPVDQVISEAAARPFLELCRKFFDGGAPDVMRVQLRHVGAPRLR